LPLESVTVAVIVQVPDRSKTPVSAGEVEYDKVDPLGGVIFIDRDDIVALYDEEVGAVIVVLIVDNLCIKKPDNMFFPSSTVIVGAVTL